MWWREAVVYQVYPRSFQDSDGDGVGDLRGIAARLDHLVDLGVDALWLSPIYPSPLHDFGYDVADFCAVDPTYGSLADFDELVAAAHRRGLRVLMDLVPCHTSIEHPWFREHPDWYVRRPPSPTPPNNWRAAFGGPAWDRDRRTGEWYLHSFYPEQPDLDWRNPDVVEAMQDVLRFWVARGVDGFRLDAIDRLLKDPEYRDDPPAEGPVPLPGFASRAGLDPVHSLNAPDIGDAVRAIREAVGSDVFLVGEVYQPTARLDPYLRHLDQCFCFELYHAPWEARGLRAALEAALAPRRDEGRLAWVLSNHDFERLPDRVGRANTPLAALLLLTLPGCTFLFQGDEIGMANGPGADPPRDRHGRDPYRHPMQWDPTCNGGFTAGEPWLPAVDPAERNVADQRRDPGSLLALYRRLIRLRRELRGDVEWVDSGSPDVLAYRRGRHLVAMSLADAERPLPPGDAEPVLRVGEVGPATLSAHAGFVATVTG